MNPSLCSPCKAHKILEKFIFIETLGVLTERGRVENERRLLGPPNFTGREPADKAQLQISSIFRGKGEVTQRVDPAAYSRVKSHDMQFPGLGT